MAIDWGVMRADSDTAVTGTLGESDDAVECAFDPEGAAHLMRILSNMYRDVPLAILREYAANARDAHIAAGNDDPIEVTLPSEWEPTLTVRDRGVGLSEREIIATYSSYGRSTKRDTDAQVGAFGIGSKSAFALATQFTVTAVKNGAMCSAVFALNSAGVGTVEVVTRERTDAPNGVTVQVPVDDPTAMRRAATALFATWEPGSVLVDGQQAVYAPDSMLRVQDGLFAQRGVHPPEGVAPGLTVVMGGIAYHANEAMLDTVERQCSDDAAVRSAVRQLTSGNFRLRLVAMVPVGGVDITPSRDDLRDTPHTIATLRRILADYVGEIDSAVQRRLEQAPTPMRLSKALVDLKMLAPLVTNGITWRGRRLDAKLVLPHPVITLEMDGKAQRAQFAACGELFLGTRLDDVVVLTGCDRARETAVRRLANRWMRHHEVARLVLAPQDSGEHGWFAWGGENPVRTLPVEDFLTQARALPATSTHQRQPRYEVFRPHGVGAATRSMTVTDLRAAAQTKRVLVAEHDWVVMRFGSRFVADALTEDDLLVLLTGNQTERGLQRRIPHAVSATNVLTEHARRVLDAASEQERTALAHQRDPILREARKIPALAALEPVGALIAEQEHGDAAQAAVGSDRLRYLHVAELLLGKRHTETKRRLSTGYPLLDVLLHNLTRFQPDEITETVTRHVQLYLDAARDQESARAA